MEEYFEYLSTPALKCKVVHRESGKKDLQVVWGNRQLQSVLGAPVETMLNRNMSEIFTDIEDSLFDWPKIISEAAMTNNNKTIEQYFEVFAKYLKLDIFGYDSHNECFYIIITDLTEKKQIKRTLLDKGNQIKHLESELKERANVDSLTKLYNFQYMIECLNNSIESYKEESENFCLLLMDIDNFKKMNQIFGFRLGDAILQNTAYLMSTLARKIDVAGRIGSDKFMLIFNNMDIEIAKIMVERLKQDIKKRSIKLDNTEISLCGALLEYSGETAEELMEKIETKLLKAKSLGKGSIIS